MVRAFHFHALRVRGNAMRKNGIYYHVHQVGIRPDEAEKYSIVHGLQSVEVKFMDKPKVYFPLSQFGLTREDAERLTMEQLNNLENKQEQEREDERRRR